MSRITGLRAEVRTELDAFSAAVNELEATVKEFESAISRNKLHDSDTEEVVEQTVVEDGPTPAAADREPTRRTSL